MFVERTTEWLPGTIIFGVLVYFLIKTLRKKSMTHCPICGCKFNYINHPALLKLKTGETLCYTCLNKVSAEINDFQYKIRKYSLDEIQEILNPKTDVEILSSPINDYSLRMDLTQMSGIIQQLLESFDIMEYSPNPDTVSGRFLFSSQRLLDLNDYTNNPSFSVALQIAIDDYKILWHRVPKQSHLSLMKGEHSLKLYFKECILNSCIRYFDKQVEQIEALKTQKARNRRVEKLAEMREYVINELNSHRLCDSEDVLNDKLKDIRAKWYQ
ncbi:MAG: hypothetical protein ACRDDZ_11225 [Marinifilaceae bacterium]